MIFSLVWLGLSTKRIPTSYPASSLPPYPTISHPYPLSLPALKSKSVRQASYQTKWASHQLTITAIIFENLRSRIVEPDRGAVHVLTAINALIQIPLSHFPTLGREHTDTALLYGLLMNTQQARFPFPLRNETDRWNSGTSR